MKFLCGIGEGLRLSPIHTGGRRKKQCQQKAFDSLEGLMEHIYTEHIKVLKIYGKVSRI